MLQTKKFKIDGTPITLSTLVRERTDEWVILLHGLQSNSSLFGNLISALQDFPLSFLAVDLVGFGDSSKPQEFDYDIGDQATTIERLASSLGIQRVHVIGHSLGGMVGTLLLDRMAGRVESLITLEGNLMLPDCGASTKAGSLPFDEFRRSFYPALMQQLRTSNEPSAVLRLEALAMIPDFVFYKTSRSIVQWSKEGKLYQIFGTSTVAKLLITGAHSAFSTKPPAMVCETAEIPGAGHFMLLDNPHATHEVIQNFQRRHSSF